MRFIKKFVKNQIIKVCKCLGETSPLLLDFSTIEDGKNASYLLDSMRTARFLEPKELQAPENKKVLIIAPHPDDEVIGMGGVLSQMVKNGCDVNVIYLTFGADESAKEEALKSADFLGYNCTHFFDFLPRNIVFDNKVLLAFSNVISQTRPEIIFIPFMLDDHDDHRRASELLLKIYEEGMLLETQDIQIWAYQVYTALPLNVAINITAVIDKKIEAINCYSSRFSQRNWAHFAKGLNAFNVRYLSGNTKKDYAELFLQVSLPNYLKMCSTYFRNSTDQCYTTKLYNKKP